MIGIKASSIVSLTGYLLDDVGSTSCGAWGLRRLKQSYSSSLIRVRRSSDNTEQDIGLSGDVLNTTALSTFLGSDDGYVVTWYDQSGNGYDITQSTTTTQPKIAVSGTIQTLNNTNSDECVYFDPTPSKYLQRDSTFIEGVPYTFSAVGEITSATSNNLFLGSIPGTTNQGLQIGPSGASSFRIAQWNNDASYTISPSFSTNTTYVMTGVKKSTSGSNGSELWISGTNKGTNTRPNLYMSSSTTTFYVGHGASFSHDFYGRLSEVIFWVTELTASQIAIAYNNQIDYYGL